MAFVLEHAGVRAACGLVMPVVLIGGSFANAHEEDGVAGFAGADAEVHPTLKRHLLVVAHGLVRDDFVEAWHGESVTDAGKRGCFASAWQTGVEEGGMGFLFRLGWKMGGWNFGSCGKLRVVGGSCNLGAG